MHALNTLPSQDLGIFIPSWYQPIKLCEAYIIIYINFLLFAFLPHIQIVEDVLLPHLIFSDKFCSSFFFIRFCFTFLFRQIFLHHILLFI